MLVLSRKVGEKIVINDKIVVTIVKIDRHQARIGIEAPENVPVYREELLFAKANAPTNIASNLVTDEILEDHIEDAEVAPIFEITNV